MLGRYLSYRATAGEPVRSEELEYLINRSNKNVASALEALPLFGEVLLGPSTRPARGLVPDPESTGLYEAVFWGDRFRMEGRNDISQAYFNRYHLLDRAADNK